MSGWHKWFLSCSFKRVQYCLLVDLLKSFDILTCIHELLLYRFQLFWTLKLHKTGLKLLWQIHHNVLWIEPEERKNTYLFFKDQYSDFLGFLFCILIYPDYLQYSLAHIYTKLSQVNQFKNIMIWRFDKKCRMKNKLEWISRF